jgi:hypothetical protein
MVIDNPNLALYLNKPLRNLLQNKKYLNIEAQLQASDITPRSQYLCSFNNALFINVKNSFEDKRHFINIFGLSRKTSNLLAAKISLLDLLMFI